MQRSDDSHERSLAGATPAWMREEDRQLQRMLVVGLLFFLVPATLARLSGWRWCPWPPGPQGRRSILGEARAAADTYIPMGFVGW